MARTKFRVEVLTPEGEVFNDEVEMVSTRTTVGSIGVLANHQPLLGMLEPTELRLYKSESDIEAFAQGEGYIQVSGERGARPRRGGHPPGDLDSGDLQRPRAPRRGGRPRGGGRLRGAAPRPARPKRWRGVPEDRRGRRAPDTFGASRPGPGTAGNERDGAPPSRRAARSPSC